MTGMLCAFIFTKSSDLPLFYFLLFLHMYNYAVIDSGYSEASSLVEDLIRAILEDLL
jgi:hypothetical protein